MASDNQRQQPILLLVVLVTVLTVVLWYILNPNFLSFASTSGPVRVYFADRISEAHQLVIDRFNQLHRGKIEVIPVDLPFDKFSTNERKELLARSLRSKSDKLDVFAVDLIWVQRFARWCEPLDNAMGTEYRGTVLPVALQSCLSDSVLVSIPLYIDIGMMYYRKDLIDRLPDAPAIEESLAHSVSWPEMRSLQTRLGYAGKPFYIFQGDDYEGLLCNYLELVAGMDPSALQSNRIDLQSRAARAALQMMVDLVVREKMTPAAAAEFDENRSYRYMLDSNAVFVRGWPNFVESFQNSYPDTTKLRQIRKAALPHFPGEPPTSVFGGWNLMLSRYSMHKPEAIEFIRFTQTKEAQLIMYEVGGFLPTSNAVYDDSTYLRRHDDLSYYHTLLQRGFNRPGMVDYTRISDILSSFVHRAITREMSVAEALDRASAMITSNQVLIK